MGKSKRLIQLIFINAGLFSHRIPNHVTVYGSVKREIIVVNIFNKKSKQFPPRSL